MMVYASSRPHRFHGLLLASALLLAVSGFAQTPVEESILPHTIAVKVQYVSAELIYLPIGTGDGVFIGDTLTVQHNRRDIARAVVVHAAIHACSARPLPGGEAIQVGDEAVLVAPGVLEDETQEPVETVRSTTAYRPHTGSALLTPPPTHSARLYTRLYSFHDSSPQGYNLTRPSLYLNAEGNRVAGHHLDYAIFARVRKDLGPNLDNRPGADARTLATVYEGWLGWISAGRGTLSLRAGRLPSPSLSGTGLVDGGRLGIKLRPWLELAGTAGYEPEPQTLGFSTKRIRIAAQALVHHGRWGGTRYDGGLGWMQQSLNGATDRNVILHQSALSVGQWFRGWLGLEMDLAAADSANPNGTTQFTSAVLNTSVRFTPNVRGSLRFNTIRFVKLLETYRSIPDSLWDTSRRIGGGASLQVRLSPAVTLAGGFGAHFKEQTSTPMVTGWLRLEQRTPPFFDTAWYRLRLMRNLFVDAASVTVGGDKGVGNGLSAYSELELYAYGYGDRYSGFTPRLRLELGGRWTPGRAWYATGSLQITSDPDAPSQALFLEVGRRF